MKLTILINAFLLIFYLSTTKGFAQAATFTYEYGGPTATGGTFIFTAPDSQYSFTTTASAGYLGAANNPYMQATKNMGPIPNGTWQISSIKNPSKFILRLSPTTDVNITYRDGFLIHGAGVDQSPAEASAGCIIIDRDSRKKLMDAFNKYGPLNLKVTNRVTSDPLKQG